MENIFFYYQLKWLLNALSTIGTAKNGGNPSFAIVDLHGSVRTPEFYNNILLPHQFVPCIALPLRLSFLIHSYPTGESRK